VNPEANITIRSFCAADEAQVIQLWRECNLVVPWNDPKRDIELKMRFQPELFLVGEIDGRIVGTAMAGYDGHRGWVNYLGVAPSQQRRGIGRRLMQEAEIALKKVGCPKLNLHVRNSNTSVLKFYESLGYKDNDVLSLGKFL